MSRKNQFVNKTAWMVTVFILVLVSVVVFLKQDKKNEVANVFPEKENLISINIKGKIFKAQIADDDAERIKGLGQRTSLCENCGMLFVFPQKGRYSFWMKDMRFPIDILWIDKDKIVHLVQNFQPDSKDIITSQVEADHVLEINAGLIEKLDIRIGDRVIYGQ